MATLRAGSSMRIADLAARFGVSTETVRRDLDALSRQGLVDRTYGGAAPVVSFHEAAVDERARTGRRGPAQRPAAAALRITELTN